jgi:hypothetical protein
MRWEMSDAYPVALGITLSQQLGTYVELSGEAPTDEGRPANSFDAGITHLTVDNLQVDILGG